MVPNLSNAETWSWLCYGNSILQNCVNAPEEYLIIEQACLNP